MTKIYTSFVAIAMAALISTPAAAAEWWWQGKDNDCSLAEVSPGDLYDDAKATGRSPEIVEEGEMVRLLGVYPGKENDYFRSREACERQSQIDLEEQAKARAAIEKYR